MVGWVPSSAPLQLAGQLGAPGPKAQPWAPAATAVPALMPSCFPCLLAGHFFIALADPDTEFLVDAFDGGWVCEVREWGGWGCFDSGAGAGGWVFSEALLAPVWHEAGSELCLLLQIGVCGAQAYRTELN